MIVQKEQANNCRLVIGDNSCNSSNVETLASSPDVTFLPALLHAVGDPERYRILQRLLESPLTQKQLAAELGLNSGTASKQMAKLVAARLVARRRSHGPYELQFRKEVWELLQGFTRLNKTMAIAFIAAAGQEEEELNRAGMRSIDTGSESESA
jgi:DNA-binding MarR family transcriptional regulator